MGRQVFWCFLSFVLSLSCGGEKPLGTLGATCRADGECAPGLTCNKAEDTCEPEWYQLVVSAPDILATTGIGVCTEQSTLGADIQAILDIGGHAPCALAVDPSTLAASGECDRVVAGVLRPLGLSYFVTNPVTTDAVLLAYVVGWVDLTVVRDITTIAVTLNGDGVSSTLLDSSEDVSALPAWNEVCDSLSDPEERNLCIAEVWAAGEIHQSSGLDIDSDTESNLLEACNGTLFQ